LTFLTYAEADAARARETAKTAFMLKTIFSAEELYEERRVQDRNWRKKAGSGDGEVYVVGVGGGGRR
jgi:hypothetical protein